MLAKKSVQLGINLNVSGQHLSNRYFPKNYVLKVFFLFLKKYSFRYTN